MLNPIEKVKVTILHIQRITQIENGSRLEPRVNSGQRARPVAKKHSAWEDIHCLFYEFMLQYSSNLNHIEIRIWLQKYFLPYSTKSSHNPSLNSACKTHHYILLDSQINHKLSTIKYKNYICIKLFIFRCDTLGNHVPQKHHSKLWSITSCSSCGGKFNYSAPRQCHLRQSYQAEALLDFEVMHANIQIW